MLEEHEPAAAEVAALAGQLGRQPGVVAAQSPSHLKIADLVSQIDGCSLRSPDFDVEVVKIAMPWRATRFLTMRSCGEWLQNSRKPQSASTFPADPSCPSPLRSACRECERCSFRLFAHACRWQVFPDDLRDASS
jgi:hypothetical protein